MKKSLMILLCLCLVSCWENFFLHVNLNEWIFSNKTSREICVYIEITYTHQSQQTRVHVDRLPLRHEIPDRYDHMYGIRLEAIEELYFLDVFTDVNSDFFVELVSSRVYITPLDGDEILKEWVYGVNNGKHDIFDESQWEMTDYYDTDSETLKQWTFTITDEDLGL